MPPRSGTAWTSDRIRPPTHKPSAHLAAQAPSKSDKGKGRASTPEPPRSTAVRKLDELLAGLRSSSSSSPTRSQRLQNNAASPAPDGCFCQGTFQRIQRTHARTYPSYLFHPSNPSAHAPALGIHPTLQYLRPDPLRAARAPPPLPTLRRTATRPLRARSAPRAARGTPRTNARGRGICARARSRGAAYG